MIRKLSCLSAVMILGWTSSVLADPRVVVRDFDGPNSNRVRATVVSELEDSGVELVPNAEADRTAREHRLDLSTEAGRAGVAAELQISAFVEGNVERVGNKLRTVVTVYGGDGSQIAEMKVTAPKARHIRVVKDRTWKAIGSDIEKAQPPPKPEKEPEVVEQEPEREKPEPVAEQKEPEPEADEDDFEPEQSPLDISVGARFSNRDFAYSDALPGLRDYEIGFSPNIALHLHWYPGAHVTNGFVANLGLDLRGEMMIGAKSTNSANQEFSTSSTRLGLGMRLRVPLEKNELGFLLGYASRSFSIDNASGIDPGVPAVSHGSLRVGADLRWMIAGPLSLQLAAAYLYSLSPGEIGDSSWFPHASGGGVEGELGLGFGVTAGLELQLALEIQRYFFSFDPSPTDVSVITTGRVAGGALDQFMALRASVVWRL